MIPGEARLRRHSKVVDKELGHSEGGVLLHLDSGQYHSVNGVGWMIWSLIDGTRTVGDIASELRLRLQDLPPQLDEDVETFVAGLHARNLIETDVAPSL